MWTKRRPQDGVFLELPEKEITLAVYMRISFTFGKLCAERAT
jgi:hypothetical protein